MNKPKYENQVIENIQVLQHIEKSKYECICPECQSHFITNVAKIICKRTKTCPKCSYINKAEKKRQGDFRGPKDKLFNDYKAKALKRKLTFDLTQEEFEVLIKQNCVYCGLEPLQERIARKNTKYVTPKPLLYNGVDRRDNTQGYTLENSVPCCGPCNSHKSNKPVDALYNWLDRAARFNGYIKRGED